MSMDAISNAPEIYNLFIDSVETDMSLGDMVQFIDVASAVLSDSNRIQRYSITTDHVTDHTTAGGAYVLLPNYDAIWEVVKQAVYTP